jgi:hypothetical protein
MREIVYVSAASRLLDPAQLGAILEQARRNNQRLGVTGVLLYDAGSFMQLLEGEPEVLQPLYERIAQDERHYRVHRVRDRSIQGRSFAAWSMGFVSIDARRVLLGRHALASNGSLLEDDAAVLEVLDAFRGGQWRSYIMG